MWKTLLALLCLGASACETVKGIGAALQPADEETGDSSDDDAPIVDED